MRIAFVYAFNDAEWAGGKNYFASLFRALHNLREPGLEIVFLTGCRTKTTLPEQFPFLEVHRTTMLDRKELAWFVRQLTLRAFDSDPLLKRYLSGLGIDLLSHSGYLGSRPGIRTLPWLFDFQFLHLPDHWTPRQLRWVARRYRSACAQAEGVVVSSRDALNDLKAFLPDARVQTHVLPFVSNPVEPASLAPAPALMAHYGLPPTYFHLPNQFWTHKNHRVVIDALAHLKRDSQRAIVVCTGNTADPRSPGHFDDLMAHAKALGVAKDFKVLGLIPYADTQILMAHATAVINPSRFEGWSTTVEEAKTLHKRLLLSDLAVHREQSPSLGRFFGPDDAPALAALMADTLRTPAPEVKAWTIEASYRERAEQFARSYLDIVGKVMA